MANPFVASAEYCEAIQKALSNPHWSRNSLCMDFETQPEFLRELLPPCFDMPDRPLGSVMIGKFQASIGGEYDAASISFQAKYKHINRDATYTVVLYISPDMPVIYGREFWGESKKLGIVQMYKCGSDIYAFAERNGTRLIEMEGTLGPDEGEQEGGPYYNLTVKCTPHAQGFGFQSNPVALVKENLAHHYVRMQGQGKLILCGNSVDPLHEIPIVSAGPMIYTESQTESKIILCDQLEKPERYLPYFYGVAYDNFIVARKGKIFGLE